MTASIRTVLAVLPTGAQGADLTWQEVGQYLREHCDQKADKDRQKRHLLRDQFYCDGGCEYMRSVIDDVFIDDTVKELRKKWVPHARFNNAVKRIVNEISSVYSAPAQRSIKDGNDAYQSILERLQFDVVMQQACRLFNLHKVLLAAPRVRQMPDNKREPVIDLVTPASFRAVLHPNDNTRVIGWLIRLTLRSVRKLDGQRVAAWVLWTDHEWVHLDDKFVPIEATVTEHGLGVCPWVPIMRSPVRAGFWPGEEGEDLVAAQVAIWMSNILLMKETKSATKQTIVAGDGSLAARGQAADSEVPSEITDGQAVSTVDMSMDLSMFRDTGDHALERSANNHGMSIAMLRHQGTQSAEAREQMRIPLRELRREQHPVFRMAERELAKRMAAVFAKDAPDLTFDPDGWRIDFGEAQTPLTPMEEILLFEKERAAGLDNTVAFYMRRNPDADETVARAAILENIEVETWRVGEMRELQAMSGGMSELVAESFSAVAPPTSGQSSGGKAEQPPANGAPPAERTGNRPPERSRQAPPA